MASGMAMMMKAMGVDPDKLLADAMQQFGSIAINVQAAETKISAIENSLVSLHEKFDAIMTELGVASPVCHAVARMSLPASMTGFASVTLDHQAEEKTDGR